MKYSYSAHVTFIYCCRSCKKWHASYFDHKASCPYCNSDKLVHSSTVDPAAIITRFLNSDLSVLEDCTKIANKSLNLTPKDVAS